MNHNTPAPAAGTSAKGLTTGRVGLLGAVVIGISCIAPAYTLTSGLGPTIAEVGQYVPAILLGASSPCSWWHSATAS